MSSNIKTIKFIVCKNDINRQYEIAVQKNTKKISIICTRGVDDKIKNDLSSLQKYINELYSDYELYYYSKYNLSDNDDVEIIYNIKTILNQSLFEPMFEFLIKSNKCFIPTKNIYKPFIGFFDTTGTKPLLYGYNNGFSFFSDEFNSFLNK